MRKRLLILLAVLSLCVPLVNASADAAQTLKGYSSAAGYQYVYYGSYPTDKDGTIRPILWRVLAVDGKVGYLLTEYVLEAKQLHFDYKQYYSWDTSDLYNYLNGDFKNKAFTEAEQLALMPCYEDNGLVTLVNSDDMKNAAFGFTNDKSRLCESTEYAKTTGLYIYSKGHKYSPWWSRTRSTDDKNQQRRVMDEGAIGRIAVTAKDLGMRPAIFLDLSVLDITSGNGTFDSPYMLSVPVSTESSAPEIDPDDYTVVNITESGDLVIEATPTPVPPPVSLQQSTATPEPDDTDAVEPTVQAYAVSTYEPHALFPALTEDGFLPEGESEFVYADKASGTWLYASQTLRIEIIRKSATEKNKPLRWYETHVFTKDNSELFRSYAYNQDKFTNKYAIINPVKIAKQHNLVLAFNSDYFIYRVGRASEVNYTYPIGIVVRNGVKYYDIPRKPGTVFPPLDIMALYEDGSMETYLNDTITADELIAKGAYDVYSFGPILVKDGEIPNRALEYGDASNPRLAFGVIEPGHYLIVMLEARISASQGSSCIWMANKMLELNCQDAFNLDGGLTANLIFMGQQISEPTNTVREQNELIGIGISPAAK